MLKNSHRLSIAFVTILTQLPFVAAEAEILRLSQIEQLRLYNHNDEAKTLVITDQGFSAEGMAKTLIQINRDRPKPIELKVLTSGATPEMSELARRYPHIIKLQTSGSAESWMQDNGEPVLVKKIGQPQPIRAFYDSGRDEMQDSYFKPFLESEKLGSFRIHISPNDTFNLGKTGDLGGNIEATPNDVLYVGSTASDELKEFFRKKGYNEKNRNLTVLDVDWLATGHVDEIISTIPLDSDACGFAIVRSSPLEAIEVLKTVPRAEIEKVESKLNERDEYGSVVDFQDIKKLHSAIHGDRSTYGRYQLRGQVILEERLKAAAEKLALAVKANSLECRNVKIVTVPNMHVCYSEVDLGAESADHDPSQTPNVFKDSESGLCKSATSSLINLVSLNEHVLALDPRIPAIKKRYTETMRSLGKSAHFIDDGNATLNICGGGLHCVSQVIRDKNKKVVRPGK